jgi:hypothetical protein
VCFWHHETTGNTELLLPWNSSGSIMHRGQRGMVNGPKKENKKVPG